MANIDNISDFMMAAFTAISKGERKLDDEIGALVAPDKEEAPYGGGRGFSGSFWGEPGWGGKPHQMLCS